MSTENELLNQDIDSEDKWYVVCETHGEKYALSTQFAVELIRTDDDATPVPMSHESFSGVINHRGVVLPVVDLRILLGFEPLSKELNELEDFMKAREQDTVTWLEELKASVETGTAFTNSLDPSKSSFGKWYSEIIESEEERNSLTGGSVVLNKILDEFDSPHKKIHTVAEQVLNLVKENQTEEALEIINHTWEKELVKMRELFKQFFETYKSQRKPSLVAIEFERERVALVVDDVDSVRKIAEQDWEEPPVLDEEHINIIGAVAKVNDQVIMRLECKPLLEPLQKVA